MTAKSTGAKMTGFGLSNQIGKIIIAYSDIIAPATKPDQVMSPFIRKSHISAIITGSEARTVSANISPERLTFSTGVSSEG